MSNINPQLGFQVLSIQENRTDFNDSMSVKLKEQVILMKQRQAELLKELEEMDSQNLPPAPTSTTSTHHKIGQLLGKTKPGEAIEMKEQTGDNQEGEKGKQHAKKQSSKKKGKGNAVITESDERVDQQKSKGKQQSSDNYLKKTNEMNIKLFEMQEKIRAKEVEKVQKEQNEKLVRFKKEKDVLARQGDKIKLEYGMKNNKLKEQIERNKVAKEAFLQKQRELVIVKQEKQADMRRLETQVMQLNYDIELQLTDIGKTEGILNSLKLQVREKDNELKTLTENIRIDTLSHQKIVNDLGETTQLITKLEFDQAKVRDERDRLIHEIEKKNDANNKRYTGLYEQYLKLETLKSEKIIHLSSQQRLLDKKKEKALDLKTDNKILQAKIERIPLLKRKIEKRDKKVFELEAYIETSKKEKRVEIVEKVIEKPVVVERPVIVEKPVLIKEEIRINEPVQLEIVRVKGEMNNLSRANNEMLNEVDYWRKKCMNVEDSMRLREDQLRVNFENEKIILSEKIGCNDQQILEIQNKINILYNEIENLYQTNKSKNSQLSSLLQDIYCKNKNLEDVIISSSHPLPRPPI